MSNLMSEEEIRYLVKSDPGRMFWVEISRNQALSESFIREFQDEVNWLGISRCQTLSESFIREFQGKLDWYWVSIYQTLSENLIREFQDKVYWLNISHYQTLSEDFIQEFWDKVNWAGISRRQTLSESFIRKFWDNLNYRNIFIYQDYGDDFDLMVNYIENSPDVLKVSKTKINMELLEELNACITGIDRFLEHTEYDETISWSELKKRHNNKSDLRWLFNEIYEHY